VVNVIVSSAGTSGPRGNAILSGVGAPGPTVGIDGDYYMDDTNYPNSVVLYGPRATGTWPGSGVTLSTSGVQIGGDLGGTNDSPQVIATHLAAALPLLQGGTGATAASGARTNLGLGGAAVLNVGTSTGTVAAGNDARITGALQAANNLADLGSAPSARSNLGLGSAATAGSATTGTQGILQLAGDLAGTAASPSVQKINGVAVSGTPAAGYVPIATGSSSATWTPIGVPLKSGWYYPQDGGGGSLTMVYQQMWVWPFDCQRAITLSKLALNVKTGGPADAVIRMGVYASDGAGGIGSLIIDAGTVAAATSGVKTITISQAAGPDRLWIAAVWQGTTTTGGPVVQSYAKANSFLGWSSYNQFPSIIGYQYTGVTGSLPASLSAPTAFENNAAPGVQFAPA
jgi:hypothetical protein